MPLVAHAERPTDSIMPIRAEDNAVGLSGETLRKQYMDECVRRLWVSIFKKEQALLSNAKKHLSSLTTLPHNWDSYGAPAPNQAAIANAARVLDSLQYFELSIVRILASAEGGIGICFVQGDSYADIECSNEGEFMGVRYVGAGAPTLIDIDGSDSSIRAGLQEIREHFGA
jgi:hypothetical protein